MTFRAPVVLWFLAALPFLLAILVRRESGRRMLANQFASERVRGVTNAVRWMRPYALTLAVAAMTLALAGPYAGFERVPFVARETNRVIVMDVSNSMAAEDVGTSRLAAAKAVAQRLAADHAGRIGLVVFEASAEVISPLTSDTTAVAALLETLQPEETGRPGSDIGGAVLEALRFVETNADEKADIVVISDGEEQGRRSDDAIRRARTKGVPISAVLVGGGDGATIPTPSGPLRDASGEIVTTYANGGVLKTLANGTGGMFVENPFGARDLNALSGRATAAVERRTHVDIPIDRFQWPMSLAFAALLCASLLNRGAE